MQISFYSLLMSVMWSSLFCIVLCLLRRFKKGFLYYNIAPLSILLFGCIFRCVLPLDFPGFTKNIDSSSVYATVNTALYTPVIATGERGKGVTPLMIFFAVWAAGTLVMTAMLLRDYFKAIRCLKIYQEVTDGPAYDMAVRLAEKQKIKRFELWRDSSIEVPHVRGFLFPRVMVPDVEYTETELRYILGHEMSHWKNGDMWVRFITVLICNLFWWNPFIYLLLFHMEETLECRCDATLIADGCLSEDERIAYLGTIQRAVEENRMGRLFSQLFSIQSELVMIPAYRRKKRGRKDKPECKLRRKWDAWRQKRADKRAKEILRHRADIITDYVPNPKKERRVSAVVAVLMAVVLVFSYRYILQPYYYVEETEYQAEDAGAFEISVDNSYIVEEEDGTFSLYVNDVFFRSITDETMANLISAGFEIRKQQKLEE